MFPNVPYSYKSRWLKFLLKFSKLFLNNFEFYNEDHLSLVIRILMSLPVDCACEAIIGAIVKLIDKVRVPFVDFHFVE